MVTTTLLLITLLCAFVTSSPLWLHHEQLNNNNVDNNRALADYLLSNDIVPLSYDITMIPFLEKTSNNNQFEFESNVIINFFASKSFRGPYIRLHALNTYSITKISIKLSTTGSSVCTSCPFSITTSDKNFLEINTGYINDYYGVMEITGIRGHINDLLEGFYRTSYYDGSGNLKWMANTQFEPTFARQAFPCFDEPRWKSNFTLHIAHAPQNWVQSNMPQEGSDTPLVGYPGLEDWTWSHFQTSVPMPTYLVAFSINQFDTITSSEDNRFRVVARPEIVHSGELALEVAPAVIQYMEDYTQHNYSLPKLDQIAVPQLSFAAMENWGLVTYRESYLLYDDAVDVHEKQEIVSTIVAHELAHQWFGNIVSPVWWNVIWLNEGFATYFEYHVVDQINPDWEMEQEFVRQQTHTVMRLDSLTTTHPLLAVVENPASASAAFDSIAYSKGGSILRMMANFMGEKAWKAGLNNYLTEREFNFTDQDYLWAAFAKSIPKVILPNSADLKSIMDPWTIQSGYPLINVTRDYNPANQSAKVYQQRYHSKYSNTSETWTVPLTITTQTELNFEDVSVDFWHEGGELQISELTASSDQWIILNKQQVGYYRVNYDVRNWFLLTFALKNVNTMRQIHVINRAQIMDDALALAFSGHLDYASALDTTAYLTFEEEHMPWAVALDALSYVYDRLSNDTVTRYHFTTFMKVRLDNMYVLLDGINVSPDDSHVTYRKRVLIATWACEFDNSNCISDSVGLFRRWQGESDPDSQNPIPKDMMGVVNCAGMRNGGQFDFDFLLARYRNTVSDHASLIKAMGCSSDTEILDRYLIMSITTESQIRPSDAYNVFSAVYMNYHGVDTALDFLIANWNTYLNVYGSTALSKYFTGIAIKLNTKAHKDKLQSFYNANYLNFDVELKAAVNSAIAKVDDILSWQTKYRKEVVDYYSAAHSTRLHQE